MPLFNSRTNLSYFVYHLTSLFGEPKIPIWPSLHNFLVQITSLSTHLVSLCGPSYNPFRLTWCHSVAYLSSHRTPLSSPTCITLWPSLHYLTSLWPCRATLSHFMALLTSALMCGSSYITGRPTVNHFLVHFTSLCGLPYVTVWFTLYHLSAYLKPLSGPPYVTLRASQNSEPGTARPPVLG